jgi:hypothetical protein
VVTAFELDLHERARGHVHDQARKAVYSAMFECPDCDDDPACRTCGEPSRAHVLSWLQLIFRGWSR